jgi:WD repeat-containing protein 44
VKSNPIQVPPKFLQSEELKEQCRIRNLDTGTEFVVKEVREDGTWEKVKEISTGRQFTFEEFEMRFSSSPIVQELMRRQQGTNSELSTTVEPVLVSSPCNSNYNSNSEDTKSPARSKKKKGWLNGFKSMAGYHHKHTESGNIKGTSAEKGVSRLSSVTDDRLDGGPRSSGVGPERIRIRQYGKSLKEFTGVYMTQEIKAHSGAVWSICFSFDGKYLASAGEDKVIHVWEVVELEKKNAGSNLKLTGIGNGSPDAGLSLSCVEMSPHAGDKKKRGKVHSRKSVSSHHVVMPEQVFQLGEKPTCSLHGHGDDVLDLSWSRSQVISLFILFSWRSTFLQSTINGLELH